MSGPLGIGVVGAGRFAAFCIAAFEGLPDARVVAVMDADRSRAQAIAPPGAKTYAELAHATIEGWIPTRLEVEGTAKPERLDKLRTLFGGVLREVTLASTGGRRTVRIAAVVERPDRQDDYRRAIRAGMANLVGAIVRNAPLEVTAEDGLRSLAIALHASSSARFPAASAGGADPRHG